MRFVAVLLSAGAVWAQISAPKLGLVPDGQNVRQMYGIAGAGLVGLPINTRRAMTHITISPAQNYAIGVGTDTGAVMLAANGQPAVAIAGVAANPDAIVVSPQGSSAALWYTATSQFEVISGLPAAPVVRDVNAAFETQPPTAFAVSDDAQWLVAAWADGVYVFGADASVHPLAVESGIEAAAFVPGSANLVLASAAQVMIVSDVANAATSAVVYAPAATLSPVGIGVTADSSRVALADASGHIYSILLADGSAAIADCGCSPEGLFGLGGFVFRLTSLSDGPVQLFDARAGAVVAVPPPPAPRARAKEPFAFRISPAATQPLPAITIGGIPATTGYDQQLPMTISIATTYPTEIDGMVTLTFASAVGGDDQLIAFSTGGRTVNFTIPAGSTQANFSGKSSVNVLTGTVAGTITVTITSATSSGTDMTPNPPPSKSTTTSPSVPFISNVVFSTTTGAASVVVTGFSSSRDMVSGLFHFAPATNNSIQQTDITVPLSSAFATWYQGSASNAFGSEFTLTVPFTVQGNAFGIVAVTVTLTNSKGSSNPVSQ